MTAVAAIPHQRIRELGDRSWTATLLEALHGAGDDERAEIADTLAALVDPRAVSGLTAIVLSSTAPPALRELAGRVLRREYDPPPAHVVRTWWDRGDRILRRHALRSMPGEAAEVIEVGGDPRHPLHVDAITQLTWGYEEPAHQQLKIAALHHHDPRVRVAAADALCWDEPRAAEDALVAALIDPVEEVALAARATLVYYDSRRVLRALATIPAPDGADHFAETARSELAANVRAQPAAVQAHLAPWLAPIADLLDDDDDDSDDDDDDDDLEAGDDDDLEAGDDVARSAARSSSAIELGPDELLALLTIVDGPWALARRQLGRLEPSTIASVDRARITARALGHDDADVRALAAGWIAAWHDEPSLRTLLEDDAYLVRKAAAYAYAALPPDPALAARLLDHLHQPGVASTHARETLRSYATHARPDEVRPILGELARADHRESVRHTAIDLLTDLGARDLLAPLMSGLAAPPRVTWAVHLALLEAARRLALPAPAAAELADTDSLAMQIALAELAISI